MRSRRLNSLPDWPNRPILAPLGGPNRSIFEYLQPPGSVSEPHFAATCSPKNWREFRPCKICDFQVLWLQSTRKSKCGLKKMASILSLQTSYFLDDMAAEYQEHKQETAHHPRNFRLHFVITHFLTTAKSLTPERGVGGMGHGRSL